MTEDIGTAKVGRVLRARATHHNHGEGWTYSRNTGDLEHIRYKHDYTGYEALHRRLKRAFNWKHLTGRDGLSAMIKRINKKNGKKPEPFLYQLYGAWAWILVSLRKDSNLPDGQVGGNLFHWEEDGEYVQMVGPTIGEKIADFLEQEPENPHAQAISAEIQRIWALAERREKEKIA